MTEPTPVADLTEPPPDDPMAPAPPDDPTAPAPAAEPISAVAPAEAQAVGPQVQAENLQWLTALRSDGHEYHEAVCDLWGLVRHAVQVEISRRPELSRALGQVRVAEIVDSATDEAAAAVLRHLDDFAGRSRFTTWIYKFGVNHAYAECRRALWRDRPVELDVLTFPPADPGPSPVAWVQAKDLAGALMHAIDTVLTAHQRRIAMALLVDGVPIDVLAERLGTTRNALYKSVHDVRRRLRMELHARGYLDEGPEVQR